MGFVRLSDLEQAGFSGLGQVMMARGGGGGGGAVYARQATQARGYTMPGSRPPISQPTVSVPMRQPAISMTPRISTVSAPTPTPSSVRTPTSAPPTSVPPTNAPPSITITPTFTPGPTFSAVPDYMPQQTIIYIEGASDPYNEFAASSVDEGSEVQSIEPESKSQYVDPFDQKKEENKGPLNVFRIEDDPTLNDLTPQEKQSVEEIREADRLAGMLVGVVAGTAVGIVGCKLWSWWRQPKTA